MFNKSIFKLIFFFTIVFSFFVTTIIGNAKEVTFEDKNVLFISSYSPAFNTFYLQIDGINDTFDGYPISVDMEFMDSKRFYNEENIQNFYNNILYKTSQVEYDVVMVSDDNGLNFVMEHRDELFPGVPVVFFGINNRVNAASYSMNPDVTGVVERISIEETIQVALDLNPQATKVVALVDATPTGKVDLTHFEELHDDFLSIEFLSIDMSKLTRDEFLIELSKVGDDSVVILFAALRDVDNITLSFDQSTELLIEYSSQPIYHVYEHGVGAGLLGGKVVSHYIQGQTAASMVLEYFNGTSFSEIDMIQESPNIYLFDYEVLSRFGLQDGNLPIETIFINKDLTFFQEYKMLITFYIIILVMAAVAITTLSWSLRQRNKSRKQLLSTNNQLEEAYQNLETLNEELTYSSFHDYLTGLHNRNFFEKELPKLDQVDTFPISIILADVNGLKLLNDAFGHLVGDKALVKTAEILEEVFKDCIISRIGGDEFAVIGYGLEDEEAITRMKEVRKAALKINLEGVTLSLSIGYAVKESHNKSHNELFTEAEDWMYREKLSQVPSNRSAIIDTIVATINQKDEYSEIHSRRVSEISGKIAELMGLSGQYINEIKTAGLLHDIGKIIVPTEILNKTGKLTKTEFDEIKKHSEIGYRILNSVSSMREISEYVFCHHERVDGKGYPRGLTGDEIPLQSKIISVADAIDAMLTDRLYRKKLSKEACYYELKKNSGTQFSTEVVNAVLPNFKVIYELVINH